MRLTRLGHCPLPLPALGSQVQIMSFAVYLIQPWEPHVGKGSRIWAGTAVMEFVTRGRSAW